jgi:hypothetical protein
MTQEHIIKPEVNVEPPKLNISTQAVNIYQVIYLFFIKIIFHFFNF